jgi:hypothetical protein
VFKAVPNTNVSDSGPNEARARVQDASLDEHTKPRSQNLLGSISYGLSNGGHLDASDSALARSNGTDCGTISLMTACSFSSDITPGIRTGSSKTLLPSSRFSSRGSRTHCGSKIVTRQGTLNAIVPSCYAMTVCRKPIASSRSRMPWAATGIDWPTYSNSYGNIRK